MVPYESLNEALIDCVKAAGGSKVVGAALWPEKPIEAAQRHLLACLNEDKPERLSPDHLLMLLRLARAKGFHDGVGHILSDLGYAPTTPIEPRDEVAELRREYIAAAQQMADTAERLERMARRIAAVESSPQLRMAA